MIACGGLACRLGEFKFYLMVGSEKKVSAWDAQLQIFSPEVLYQINEPTWLNFGELDSQILDRKIKVTATAILENLSNLFE